MDTPDEIRVRIGRRIRRERNAAGLSQTGLAERLGVLPGYISRWENGHTRPTKVNLQALALALGVDVERFFRD
jgi:transcriptional regulator with XRE-family HTH domain